MNAFEQSGINLTEKQLRQFEVYCEFLLSENEKYNLTAVTDKQQVYQKHFVDSLSALSEIPQNATLCDVGSGAGFPSVPIAIMRSDVKVTAVDSLAKRVNFLKMLAEKLGVTFSALHERAEEYGQGSARESFDVATSRAVAPLPTLLEYLAPLVKTGGKVIAYKTDEEEIFSAETAAKVLGLKFSKVVRYTVEEAPRVLLIYEKTHPTSTKYPRGQNKPRKNPL